VLTQKYPLFAKKIAPGNMESAISQILFWCASLDFTFDTTSTHSHIFYSIHFFISRILGILQHRSPA